MAESDKRPSWESLARMDGLLQGMRVRRGHSYHLFAWKESMAGHVVLACTGEIYLKWAVNLWPDILRFSGRHCSACVKIINKNLKVG